jgi:uncharacterized protein
MSSLGSCLYVGEVMHRRLAPVRHELRYKVYNLFIDVDEIAKLSKKLNLLSYNRFNLFALNDRNFGQADGTSIKDYAWSLVRRSLYADAIKRIFMFCYPSVLGRVFNPLTTYYCFDAQDQLRLMIYEVSNTFGERHSYVVPVDETNLQSCKKRFYVSPFNKVEGHYDFTVQLPADELKLGVRLTNSNGPCLNAWFSGTKQELTDQALLRSFFSLPLLPLKIMGGIHWEALKLWIKGMRLQQRPKPLMPPISFAKTPKLKGKSK